MIIHTECVCVCERVYECVCVCGTVCYGMVYCTSTWLHRTDVFCVEAAAAAE